MSLTLQNLMRNLWQQPISLNNKCRRSAILIKMYRDIYNSKTRNIQITNKVDLQMLSLITKISYESYLIIGLAIKSVEMITCAAVDAIYNTTGWQKSFISIAEKVKNFVDAKYINYILDIVRIKQFDNEEIKSEAINLIKRKKYQSDELIEKLNWHYIGVYSDSINYFIRINPLYTYAIARSMLL